MIGEEPSSLPPPPGRAVINIPVDTRGNTYLHEICGSAKTTPDDIRRAVSEAGADPNKLNNLSLPPLGIALMKARPDTIACLIELGAELYIPLADGKAFNAVTLAILRGAREVLTPVLELGGGLYVNLPGIDDDGRAEKLPGLHLAVKKERESLLPALIEAGGHPSGLAGEPPLTPLMIAAMIGFTRGLPDLVNAGAALEETDPEKRTALIVAAQHGRTWALQELLRLGANPDAKNHEGKTPLMLAAEGGHVDICRMLVESYKADVNIMTDNGKTALMFAAGCNKQETVKIFLGNGANPLLTDAFNKTALYYSEMNSDGPHYDSNAIQELLRAAMAEAETRDFEKSYRKYRP